MNSAEIAQRNNSRFFFISVVLAVLLLAAASYLVKSMFAVDDSHGVDASTKACVSLMRTSGFNPTVSDSDLSVKLAGKMNLESLVYKSGVIIASCPAYTVKDYCAGTGCPTPGLSFTLTKKEH